MYSCVAIQGKEMNTEERILLHTISRIGMQKRKRNQNGVEVVGSVKM